MDPRWPDAWPALLLALAAYRVTRLVILDEITEGIRDRFVPDEGKLHTLFGCPWCMGAYIATAIWAGWLAWPDWTTMLAVPFALSAAIGIIGKNLDA